VNAPEPFQNAGFANVAVLRGGMEQWKRDALSAVIEASASW
jgi:rhodanese-related sulfurtransferase